VNMSGNMNRGLENVDVVGTCLAQLELDTSGDSARGCPGGPDFRDLERPAVGFGRNRSFGLGNGGIVSSPEKFG